MSGTQAGREAIAEEFTQLVERAMDQMDFIQPLKDMIKRSKAHDQEVDDKIRTLENKFNLLDNNIGSGYGILKSEIKELRECLKSGDLPKEKPKENTTFRPIAGTLTRPRAGNLYCHNLTKQTYITVNHRGGIGYRACDESQTFFIYLDLTNFSYLGNVFAN